MKVINFLLGYKNLRIVQDKEMFNFSLDSILLPNFVTINKNIKNVLDIGCGNAPIPLVLSTRTDAKIKGIEIQKEVFDLAVETINLNSKETQITIINEDINEFYKKEATGTYDVITCNPPFFKYSEESNVNNSKYKTIARHEIKLNLESIFKISKKLLKNNGVVAIVHRPERLMEILIEMKKNNIEPKRVRFVYPKKDKEANMLLIEGRKNGNPGLKILPPLYSHNEDGSYSDEVKKYFTD